ncbi:MAG: hypothetical protein R2730_05410 [Chitinophagales bacterium]
MKKVQLLIVLVMVMSSSLFAQINKQKVTSEQVSLIKRLTWEIPDTLSENDKYLKLNTLVKDSEYKAVKSIKRNITLDLIYMFKEWELADSMQVFSDSINQIILEKSNAFVKQNMDDIKRDAERYEVKTNDELLIKNMNGLVAHILMRNFIAEGWDISKLINYNFEHFEQVGIKALIAPEDIQDENLKFDQLVRFFIINSDKSLF